MIITSEIIGVPTLSVTEQNIVATAFSDPTVKRYLKIMMQNDIIELATLSLTEKDDSTIAKKHAIVQGKLSVLQTLLSINAITKE